MRTTNCTLHESRGLSRVNVAEKNYLEWLETTNNDLTFIPYCEFQREGFAREWLLLGLFQLIVLRTLHPCSAKSLPGRERDYLLQEIFFSLQLEKTASWISQWFNSLVHRADICLCRSTYSVNSVEKKTRIYKIRQTSWMLLRVKNAWKYSPSFYGRY